MRQTVAPWEVGKPNRPGGTVWCQDDALRVGVEQQQRRVGHGEQLCGELDASAGHHRRRSSGVVDRCEGFHPGTERYLARPNPSTVVVAVASKVDKRIKLYAQLSKKGFLHALEAPRQLAPDRKS